MRQQTLGGRIARLGWLAVVLSVAPAVTAAERLVTVTAGDADLGTTPVLAEVPASIPPGDYRLEPVGEGGDSILANVLLDRGKPYLGFVLQRAGKGTRARYRLTPASDLPSDRGVRLEPSGEDVEIRVGGRPLTTYRPATGPKPFFWPLIGPTGEPITRAFPMKDVEGEPRDHPHQRSFWFTHGKVNGVDFWSEMNGHGSIRETSRPTVASGAAVGLLRTTDDWLGPDGSKILEDERAVIVFDAGPVRILDVDVTLKATAGPVTFGDTKEGMFGVRVASTMDVNRKQGGRITNAEGLLDEAAWGKPSPWVDYTGPVAGKTVGVAILNHPESFRAPTPWHVRTYGLFAANPFGYRDFGLGRSGDHSIPAGESIRFRYRVLLHEGETAVADIAGAYRSYANPPRVEVDVE